MKIRITTVLLAFCCSILAQNVAIAADSEVKLKEVVVTATKTEKDPKDVTQTVTVITADEIKKSGALTAAEVIERTAGVDLHDYGTIGSTALFSIRGSTAAQVLVLLDGRRLNSAQDGLFNMANLPVALDAIDRIEIVRGPSSALYGADALGGVINIITKKPTALSLSVTATAGTHDFQTFIGSTSNKIGNAYYNVYASNEHSDGYRDNSSLDQTTIGGKAGYDFSKDTSLEFAIDYLKKKSGSPGSTLYLTPVAQQWDRNLAMGLTLKTKVTNELDFRANVYTKRDKLLFEDASTSTDSRHITRSTGTELQTNWLMTSWNLLTLGAEAKADRIESSDLGDHSASLTALYLQDEISIGEPLILVLGGRYDKHSVYGENLSPRISARYLIATTGTIIRASWGEAFRAPTFNDLYWSDPYMQGNTDLKPEKSVEYEGGLEQPLGKGRSIKFTAFERQTKNLIVWMPTNTSPNYPWTPMNVNSARVWGYEAEAKATFFDALVWGVNYTYMNTVDQTNGDHIIGAPAEQFKTYFNITVPKVKTNLYLEGRYVRNYWIQTVGISNPSRHYSVFDAKIQQPVTLASYAKTDFFVGVKNMFDRKYEVSGGYPMPPTEFYGGLTIMF